MRYSVENKNVPLPLQEPNADDPLNKEAAELLQSNKKAFEQQVYRTMRGFHSYDRVTK